MCERPGGGTAGYDPNYKRPTLKERLTNERSIMEERIKNINNVLEVFRKNPELEETFDKINQY